MEQGAIPGAQRFRRMLPVLERSDNDEQIRPAVLALSRRTRRGRDLVTRARMDSPSSGGSPGRDQDLGEDLGGSAGAATFLLEDAGCFPDPSAHSFEVHRDAR